jgi:hypothetical protein
MHTSNDLFHENDGTLVTARFNLAEDVVVKARVCGVWWSIISACRDRTKQAAEQTSAPAAKATTPVYRVPKKFALAKSKAIEAKSWALGQSCGSNLFRGAGEIHPSRAKSHRHPNLGNPVGCNQSAGPCVLPTKVQASGPYSENYWISNAVHPPRSRRRRLRRGRQGQPCSRSEFFAEYGPELRQPSRKF